MFPGLFEHLPAFIFNLPPPAANANTPLRQESLSSPALRTLIFPYHSGSDRPTAPGKRASHAGDNALFPPSEK